MKKKQLMMIITMFICLIGLVLGIFFILSNKNNIFSKEKIIINETANIKYENYNNGLFSMKIPKGWKVNVLETSDYLHYTFMVYNPNNENYRIFFNMETEGYLKNETQHKWYDNYYPTSPISILPAIDPQTTEQFYKIFTTAMKDNNTETFKFPVINEFTKIAVIGKNETNEEIIRAIYTNDKEEKVEGIFTATIKEITLYYVNALNVSNTFFYTTPENQLIEWENILNYCVSTIEFSDTFVNSFNSQENTIDFAIKANTKIYKEMTDIIHLGWQEKAGTYDITSQKQSDELLGYERVYDIETNKIYKVTSGFMETYNGTKYAAITDDMYNLPTVGYIK